MSETNLYAAPNAVLEKPVNGYVPGLGWRLYFAISVLSIASTPALFYLEVELSPLDYIDHVLFWLSTAGVFGMVYQKRVLRPWFWRAMIPITILWFLLYTFVAPVMFGAEHYGEPAVYDWWVILELGMMALACFAFYLYAFKMPQVWGVDKAERA